MVRQVQQSGGSGCGRRVRRSLGRHGFPSIRLTIVLLLIVAACLLIVRGLYPLGYASPVERYSGEYGIDRALLYAVIKAESGFQPHARSSSGALGLMQVMPGTGSWVASQLGIPFAEETLLEPEKNIRIGSYYLRHLLDLFGDDLTAALAAYNCGLGNVLDWMRRSDSAGNGPPAVRRRLGLEEIQFPETREFVARVLVYRRIYRVLYPLYFG